MKSGGYWVKHFSTLMCVMLIYRELYAVIGDTSVAFDYLHGLKY
jgi:hypothetical protein